MKSSAFLSAFPGLLAVFFCCSCSSTTTPSTESTAPPDGGATSTPAPANKGWCASQTESFRFCDDFDSSDLLQGWEEIGREPAKGSAETGPSDRSAPRALFIRGITSKGTEIFASGAVPYREFDVTKPRRVSFAADVRIDKVGLQGGEMQFLNLVLLGFKKGSFSVVDAGVNMRPGKTDVQGGVGAEFPAIPNPPRGKWFRLGLSVTAGDAKSTIEVTYDGARVGSTTGKALDDADSVGVSMGSVVSAPVESWVIAYDNLTFDIE